MTAAYLLRLPQGPGNPTLYYAGYTTKGPTLVEDPTHAYRFPEQANADNVLAGDERLSGGQVVPAEIIERKAEP